MIRSIKELINVSPAIDIDHSVVNKDSKTGLVPLKNNFTKTLFLFNVPVRLAPQQGLAALVVASSLDPLVTEVYLLDRQIRLQANTPFNMLSMTGQDSIYLLADKAKQPRLIKLDQTISLEPATESLQVQAIYDFRSTLTLSKHEEILYTSNYYQVLIASDGALEVHEGHKKHLVNRNDCYILAPYSKASIQPSNRASVRYLSICLNFNQAIQELVGRVHSLNNAELKALVKAQELAQQENPRMEWLKFYCQYLFLSLASGGEATVKSDTTIMQANHDHELLEEMIAYIQDNIETKHEVSDLVEHFDLSRSTIQGLFNHYLGQSPKDYINDVRMEKSKQLIRNSQMNLSQISEKLGFGSIQYFSRAFKKKYKITPSHYAKTVH
ncbi:helix-turn-helix transcriptional regulator [Hutsoniella sourekii]|uniref:helix-turn-helix transcriptional regulator n=1 Tax=Hutsoniella sourekii TaxID=87650 RepID=UPI0004AF9F65|nr:helix-turn-helix transcriptional regulator [Hutsoniella sourekii]